MTECKHCGMLHQGTCPRISAIDYYPNGSIKRIEYFENKPLENIPITSVFSPQYTVLPNTSVIIGDSCLPR
jgi:hypothetical protein